MKQLTLPLLLLQYFFAFTQPTVLHQGDLAIIGFNFKNPDEFSFVSFIKLDPGTVIYFTDSGWKSDNTFRRGEGLITYTAPKTGTNAFQVINYPYDPGFKTEGIDGFFGFAVGGDQLFAFQGSFASPYFLFGINANDGTWQSDAIDNNSSKLPDDLRNTPFSLVLSKDNGLYNCQLEFIQDKSILANSIGSISNWFSSNERYSLPSICFDGTLPLAIISFEIDYHPSSFSVALQIQGTDRSLISLEGSHNGIDFTTIDSTIVLSGYNRLSFTSSTQFKYIRIKSQESNSTYYSEIKALSNFKKEPEEMMIYTTLGQLLLHEKSKSVSENQINQLKETHTVILIKKLYADGSVKIEKIVETR